MRIIERMVQELRDSIDLSRYHANELAELLEDTNESVTTSTQRTTNMMTIEQKKLVISLIAEDMEKHAKLSLDPLHKRSIKRVELLCATLAAFNELTNPETKENQ